MPLTDTAIRSLKPKDKEYKVSDEKGLYLLVTPSGGRLWRLKFRAQGGTEKKLSLGRYPEVSLRKARDLRDAARAQVADGIDPAAQKRRAKAAAKVSAENTFTSVAEAFIAKNERDGLSSNTIKKRRWLVGILKKSIGHLPISEIEPRDVLDAVRPFEAAKNDEKAIRAMQFVGAVIRYAIANQLAKSDPTRDLRGALSKRKSKPHAAILEPKRVGELLRAIDGYEGQGLPTTKMALQILPYVFVRPGELQRAEWAEIDLDAAVWRIPAARMKGRKEHAVPLSRQVIELFKALHAMTGDGRYVFPSIRTPLMPISENTMNAALRRLGYTKEEMTAHGFRAIASSLLNESGKWSPDAIERALAHVEKNSVRGAYLRSPYWPERVEMAQWWADYLDTLRDGAEILPFARAKSG